MSGDFQEWDNVTPHESPYEVQRAFRAIERRRKRTRAVLLAVGLAAIALALALASALVR